MGEYSCDVVSAARRLADALCGPEPEKAEKAGHPPASSIVYELQDRADYLSAQLATTLEILQRIAGRVGLPANPPSSYPKLARG